MLQTLVWRFDGMSQSSCREFSIEKPTVENPGPITILLCTSECSMVGGGEKYHTDLLEVTLGMKDLPAAGNSP